MKKLVLSMFAVAALASCVQNETINPGSAIDFGAPFVGNATKAADPSYGQDAVELKEFYVYGTVQGTGAGIVSIFEGDKVYGNGLVGTSTVWNCDKKQYWIKDAQYNFAAVKNGEQEETTATTVPSVTVVDGLPSTIKYTTANQYDLLYATATATGKATGNESVDFNFQHLLSKAQFTVTSNTTDGYYHKVTGITVNNFAEGTYTVGATNPWSTYELTPSEAISFGDINKIDAVTTATNATQMFLLPTKSKFNVTFTVEIWNGSIMLGSQNYTKEVEIKNGETVVGLEAGKAYNFQLGLSVGELIQFTVSQQPTWASGGNSNLSL